MSKLERNSFPKRLILTCALAIAALLFVSITSEVGTAASPIVWSGDDVSIDSTFTVPPGQELRFDPSKNPTVEISGNLIVEGTLEMRPQPGVTHILRFVGVDESKFVGGGMDVLESDRGLWVIGSGQLDLLGEKKVGWNRTGDDPSWDNGDELRVAPTAIGDFGADGFKKFTRGSSVPRADSTLPPAEVINLTRSERIEGKLSARSHVMIMSSKPQSIKYVALRHMGPRQGPEGDTEGVLGRCPLHFHFAGDGSRGSMVEGNVFGQSGHRAVVPHATHGVTVKDNFAYDIFGTPFWWDLGPENASNDIIWEQKPGSSPTPSLTRQNRAKRVRPGAVSQWSGRRWV